MTPKLVHSRNTGFGGPRKRRANINNFRKQLPTGEFKTVTDSRSSGSGQIFTGRMASCLEGPNTSDERVVTRSIDVHVVAASGLDPQEILALPHMPNTLKPAGTIPRSSTSHIRSTNKTSNFYISLHDVRPVL